MKILNKGAENEKKEYCLIGLNKFNLEVGKFLVNDGHKVTVLDCDSKRINTYGDRFNYAVVCDVTNMKELAAVGMDSFDYVVVGITDIGTSVITATNLKELKVSNILCKAKDEAHKRILRTLGIATAYIPEEEIAAKVSYKLIHNIDADIFSLSGSRDILFAQVLLTNEDLYDQQIKDVDFIKNMSVTVVSLKREDGSVIVPVSGTDILNRGDTVFLFCKRQDLGKIKGHLSGG